MNKTKSTKKSRYYICSRIWRDNLPVFYVRELPGEGGVDWGYVEERRKARPVSTYWARRFVADMRRVGAIGVSCVESV